MHHRPVLQTILGLSILLTMAVSGCSSHVQVSQATYATAARASTTGMPAPQAPFDETRITPVETVGASSAD